MDWERQFLKCIEDRDAALAREAALREALSEIIVKVQESRSETRRLNWIEGRCQSALEGKPWVKGVFQMPDPRNGKPKEERLSRELAALREELAEALTNHRTHTARILDERGLLRESLAAAEQRNATAMLGIKKAIAAGYICDESRQWLDQAYSALKPTESGASE